MSVDEKYFNQFKDIVREYLPEYGQGKTMASQVVTAINNLINKWFINYDVYDNTYKIIGGLNDLSSYANWLSKNIDGAKCILVNIQECECDEDYEEILKELSDKYLNTDYLRGLENIEVVGNIYNCTGEFKYIEDGGDDEW